MADHVLPAKGSISSALTYLPLNSIVHIFSKINTSAPPPTLRSLSSSSIYYFLSTSHPFSTSSSLLLTPPSTAASPCCPAKQASSRVGLMIWAESWPRALAQDQSSDPGRPVPRLAPPQSGTGAPLFPGLQLEERRLEREGGAD